MQSEGSPRVYARVDARNARSLRVVEKLGMTREGVLRRHIKRHQERIDDVYYGVLREEWSAAHAKAAGPGLTDRGTTGRPEAHRE